MVIRIWEGVTPADKVDGYLEHLEGQGLKQIAATDGNRGMYLGRRIVEDRAEWILVTAWDSMEAVEAFAGPEPEKAVYQAEDKDFLLELTPFAKHYEVVSGG
jgi:heme-degrading monooxygenase HmoA